MSRLRDGIDGLSDTDLPDSSERQFNRAGLNETIKEKCLKVCCSHSRPENLKKVQAKKLVKSNKSKFFFVKLHFWQF